MTNISKLDTNDKDYKIAYKQLINLITNLQKNTSRYFIDELMTESEQILFVKRFAAVYMYSHSYSPYRVSQTLSISTSTANRLYARYNTEEFSNLLGCIPQKKSNEFLSLINDLITAKASPRARARLLNRVL